MHSAQLQSLSKLTSLKTQNPEKIYLQIPEFHRCHLIRETHCGVSLISRFLFQLFIGKHGSRQRYFCWLVCLLCSECAQKLSRGYETPLLKDHFLDSKVLPCGSCKSPSSDDILTIFWHLCSVMSHIFQWQIWSLEEGWAVMTKVAFLYTTY